jgi:tetraacyldisaccharide 4'-kinase
MPGNCHIIDRRRAALRVFVQSTLGVLAYPAFRAIFNSRRTRYLSQRASLPGAPIVGIGGISLGGSGKTPVVCALHDAAAQAGKRGAVVLKLGRDPRHFLDELLLYATRFSAGTTPKLTIGDGHIIVECESACVCAHRNKIDATRLMAQREGVDYVIVDDAHQLFSLQPALSICLLLPRDGNGRLFPLGLMREELDAAGRADLLLARREQGPLPTVSKPQLLYTLDTHGLVAANRLLAPWLAEKPAEDDPAAENVQAPIAFAGIGWPHEFEQSLSEAGAKPLAMARFPDHYNFRVPDLRMLERTRVRCSADGFVTTEKDACRLLPVMLRALDGEGREVALPGELLPPPTHYLPDLIVAAREVWERTSFLRVDAALPDEVTARFLKTIGA